MSDASTAEQVLAKVGLWWPDADEGQLREAANRWRELANAIDAATLDASGAAARVREATSGTAAVAFCDFWARYDGACDGYLPSAANSCRQLAEGCDAYADAVADAKRKLEELAVEIGATLVVGAALAFFTFAASEAAAGAISAGLIAAARGDRGRCLRSRRRYRRDDACLCDDGCDRVRRARCRGRSADPGGGLPRRWLLLR